MSHDGDIDLRLVTSSTEGLWVRWRHVRWHVYVCTLRLRCYMCTYTCSHDQTSRSIVA